MINSSRLDYVKHPNEHFYINFFADWGMFDTLLSRFFMNYPDWASYDTQLSS